MKQEEKGKAKKKKKKPSDYHFKSSQAMSRRHPTTHSTASDRPEDIILLDTIV
jgi:hypothetical protein